MAVVTFVCYYGHKEWDSYLSVKFGQEEKVEYDMCRVFEQLEARGVEIGEERINRLYTLLFSEKRYDELEKAMADKEYRETLYKEIQLV